MCDFWQGGYQDFDLAGNVTGKLTGGVKVGVGGEARDV